MTRAEKELLIEQETEKVLVHLGQHGSTIAGFGRDAESFVRATLSRHRDLIDRWGGLRFYGPRVRMETLMEEDVTSAVEEVRKNFLYGRLFGKHRGEKPLMLNNYNLYKSRTFNTDQNVTDVEIMAGVTVRIRRGQRVAAAVLDGVRRLYGETEPLYEQAFGDLFEALGHRWSSGHPVSVTISVAPSDFIRLGNLCEGQSCHGSQAGGQDTYKTRLSRYPRSVVYFFHNNLSDSVSGIERVRRSNIHGRAWGYLGTDSGWASNIYALPWARVDYALCATIPMALGMEGVMDSYRPRALDGLLPSSIQCNGDVNLFTFGSTPQVREDARVHFQRLIADHERIYRRVYSAAQAIMEVSADETAWLDAWLSRDDEVPAPEPVTAAVEEQVEDEAVELATV
jgi:hypothetical protein